MNIGLYTSENVKERKKKKKIVDRLKEICECKEFMVRFNRIACPI